MQPWQPQQQPPAWNPQPLPGALPQRNADDLDLAALSPFSAKVAAGLVATAGLCAVLGSLQTWISLDYFEWWVIGPVLDALLGVACIGFASRLVSARRWAAIAALVGSTILALVSGAWCVFALMNGLFAVFVLITPILSGTGIVVAAICIGACDRAEKARARLAAQGLELGL
ncbi:MAG TPA: hypothetical protein VGH28_27835 [Polyangiaceae bacterium]|jgi:hypothetical protein